MWEGPVICCTVCAYLAMAIIGDYLEIEEVRSCKTPHSASRSNQSDAGWTVSRFWKCSEGSGRSRRPQKKVPVGSDFYKHDLRQLHAF